MSNENLTLLVCEFTSPSYSTFFISVLEDVPAKLVNSCDNKLADPFPEKLPEKRTSSGLGDSSIDSSNPELDALSKMVVDKVLEKIKNSSDGGLNKGKYLFLKETLSIL